VAFVLGGARVRFGRPRELDQLVSTGSGCDDFDPGPFDYVPNRLYEEGVIVRKDHFGHKMVRHDPSALPI
jgi:hypothetical protein